MKKLFLFIICLSFGLLSFSNVNAAQFSTINRANLTQQSNAPSQGETRSTTAESHVTIEEASEDEKPKKKVIKNIEYYLLAGFFVILGALFFFLRKKK